MGLPMIISCPEGEATGIVQETGAGLVVAPEDPQQIADSILKLYRDLKIRRTLAENSANAASLYDRTAMAEKMVVSFLSATARVNR